jgi:hypothetical protein
MRNLLLLLVAIAAVAVGLLLRSSHAAPTAPPESAPPSAAPQPAELPGVVMPGSAVERAPAPTPEPPAPPARSEVAEPAVRAELDGPRLLVQSSGRALAGADVCFVDLDGLPAERHEEWRAAEDAYAALLAQNGLALRADENGETRLPRFAHDAVIAGRWQSLRGARRVRADEQGIVLELGEPKHLTIAVRDDRGAPVRLVTVGLRRDANLGGHLVWRSETGADGTVAVLPQRLDELATGTPLLTATLAFPLREGPRHDLDLHALPEEPVVLQLPPTGRVTVLLTDTDGQSTDDLRVTLRATATSSEDSWASSDHRLATLARAEFPFVGLGLRLVAEARLENTNEPVLVEFDGPASRGEHVTVELSLRGTDGTPVVVLRVLVDGNPLPSERLRAKLEARKAGSSKSSSLTIRTDARGVVRFKLNDDFGASATRSLSLIGEGTAVGRQAVVAIPDTLRPGDNDLGDCALTLPPIACSGHVRDPEGAAIAGASLELEERVDDHGTSWRKVASSISDASGQFEIRIPATAAALRITAVAHGFRSAAPEPVGFGESKVLVLERGCGIEGSVVLGTLLDPTQVVVELEQDGQRDTQRVRRSGDLGEFAFESLPSGTARVVVRLLGEIDGGETFEGVALRPGEITRDPRLQRIDLTRGARAITLTVVDPSGTPVRDAGVAVLRGGEDQSEFEGHLLPQGIARLVTRSPALDVIVFAPGRGLTRVFDVRDGQRIVLPDAATLRLRLPSGIVPPGAPFALNVRVSPKAPSRAKQPRYRLYRGESGSTTGTGMAPWEASVDADWTGREAVARVAGPGTYTATWLLSRPGAESIAWVGQQEVRVVEGETAVTVELQQSDFDRARKELE